MYAKRTRRMKRSAIRELLKVTRRPEVISFAGGLPAAELFPIPQVEDAIKTVLAKLEREDRAAPKGFEDLPLFAAPYASMPAEPDGPFARLTEALSAMNPDEMSPREALEALYSLKAKLNAAGKE